MKLISNKNLTDPAINLALEEYCVRNLSMESDDFILFYINEPSVIIGKHQNTIEEINQDYIKENKIHVVRRISGGGTVYHDLGNLNFSFMTRTEHGKLHNFALFTGPVVKTLNELGINAELSGRNDIVVGSRKISGNAQFTNTRNMFSHGTLLFDSQLDDVSKALNVKAEKIESKGIKSVRSRVANICEFLTEELTILEFKDKLLKSLFPDALVLPEYKLSSRQWDEVLKLSETKYKSWDWNYGRSPEFNIQRTNRFSAGLIDARIQVKDGIIEEIKIFGDFLGYGDISDLENLLKGVKYEESEIRNILNDFEMEYYFGKIDKEEFVKFLYI